MALKEIVWENKRFSISYEIVNPSVKRDFVVLHGWGSNKEIMKNSFAKYLHNFRHIYIDMPGFGKSSNDYILKTRDYKEIIELFLKELNSDKYVVAGHSYGGKVATLLNPKNLVLLSSAGVLEEKSTSVKLKIKFAKFCNSIGLKSFTKAFRSKDVDSMSEAMYGTFKNVVNEDFQKEFREFSGNALIFWGEDDSATSLESGKKISELIKNSTFKSFKGDHYFFAHNAEDISKGIENGTV